MIARVQRGIVEFARGAVAKPDNEEIVNKAQRDHGVGDRLRERAEQVKRAHW